jgi:hypothetical protein
MRHRYDPARGAGVQTYTGRFFYFTDPRPEDVVPEDVAWALARAPRFTGHTLGDVDEPYTVAQHSFLVSAGAEPPPSADPAAFRFAALLHDAHEGYMGDLSTPLAWALGRDQVADLKAAIQLVIHRALGLPTILPSSWTAAIRVADRRALATERRDLMAPADWSDAFRSELLEPFPGPLCVWDAGSVHRDFLYALYDGAAYLRGKAVAA